MTLQEQLEKLIMEYVPREAEYCVKDLAEAIVEFIEKEVITVKEA